MDTNFDYYVVCVKEKEAYAAKLNNTSINQETYCSNKFYLLPEDNLNDCYYTKTMISGEVGPMHRVERNINIEFSEEELLDIINEI